jgi:hypothetical protein
MNKCTKNENGCSINMCEDLLKAFQMQFIDQSIKTATNNQTGEKLRRVATHTPLKKKKYFALSFCPFCGADIDTSDYGLGE